MVFIPMKRSREAELDTAITTMANYLMLLSRGPACNESHDANTESRVFECKTCNRQFPSFQALGGHRASHKKPRLADGEMGSQLDTPAKPKKHECSICGLEFASGQALGGHMRRHRAASVNNHSQSPPRPDLSVPVVKKVNSRRVFSLDLNLTPMENLEFSLGKAVPTVFDLFL